MLRPLAIDTRRGQHAPATAEFLRLSTAAARSPRESGADKKDESRPRKPSPCPTVLGDVTAARLASGGPGDSAELTPESCSGAGAGGFLMRIDSMMPQQCCEFNIDFSRPDCNRGVKEDCQAASLVHVAHSECELSLRRGLSDRIDPIRRRGTRNRRRTSFGRRA